MCYACVFDSENVENVENVGTALFAQSVQRSRSVVGQGSLLFVLDGCLRLGCVKLVRERRPGPRAISPACAIRINCALVSDL